MSPFGIIATIKKQTKIPNVRKFTKMSLSKFENPNLSDKKSRLSLKKHKKSDSEQFRDGSPVTL